MGAEASAGGPPEAHDEAVLAATVERLRDEVDGLRQAMRTRAVIEQAKGMMMERHGISTDDAFERLSRISQRANVKLVDVAAALVDTGSHAPGSAGTPGAGSEPPPAGGPADRPTPADVARSARQRLDRPWPAQASGTGEFGRRIRAQGRGARLRAELMAASTPGDLLDTVVGIGSGEFPPDVAALAVLDVNGVLHTLGSRGIPSAVAARWRDLPVDLPLLGCLAARTGEPQWLAEPVDGAAIGFGLAGEYASAAVLPLAVGQGRAVLVLAWNARRILDDAARAELIRLAAAAGVAVDRLPATAGPGARELAAAAQDPTVAVLDVLYDPVLLCEPVIGPAGALTDLRLLHANPSATDQRGRAIAGQTGRSVAELLPDVVGKGLLPACEQVWRAGVQAELARERLRITRYRDGLLITWAAPRPGPDEAIGPGSEEGR